MTDEKTTLRLLGQGALSNEQIAECVGLSIEVVNTIAEESLF